MTRMPFSDPATPAPWLERTARWMLASVIVVTLLTMLAGCVGATPAQIDSGAKVAGAFAVAAGLWLNSLQASGAITPEQAAEFGTLIGQAQSTIDMFAAAAKATAQAVGQLRAELMAAKDSSWTTEEIAGAGVATAGLAAAIVQGVRGPSATTEERVKRAQAKRA